jgi:hypothetical protein
MRSANASWRGQRDAVLLLHVTTPPTLRGPHIKTVIESILTRTERILPESRSHAGNRRKAFQLRPGLVGRNLNVVSAQPVWLLPSKDVVAQSWDRIQLGRLPALVPAHGSRRRAPEAFEEWTSSNPARLFKLGMDSRRLADHSGNGAAQTFPGVINRQPWSG